jgi:hypothetical protein
MSTKIYNGYKFKTAPSLTELQKISFKIRDRVKPIAANLYYKRFIFEMVDAFDKNQYGYWDESMYFINQMRGELYSGVDMYLYKRIQHMEMKQERDPSVDFKFSYTVIPLQSRNEVLLLLYTEQKLLLEAFESMSEIEDYHYQNSSDRPKKISEKLWEQRRKDWDEALGGDGWATPAESGFTYEPFTSGKFHFYGLSEVERERLNNLIPTIENRAKVIAELIMGTEFDEANPVAKLPENATKEQQEERYQAGMDRYWKFREYMKNDDGKKVFAAKVRSIKKELQSFSWKELTSTKITFHEKLKPMAEKGVKPYWMEK